MRQNMLRTLWRQDQAARALLLLIPGSFPAEVLSHQGWDALFIDMQHGAIDERAVTHMLTAVSTTQTVPVVRVPGLNPAMIGKVLDAGAYGVICPMIDTAEEAEAFVAASRYPPRGNRSCGPFRARLYGGSDYLEQADDTIVTFAMIETRLALQNLEEIAATPGLDAVFIGPSDLSMALGLAPRFDQESQVFFEALDRILETARRRNVVAAIHTASTDYARRMIERGFRFVSICTDVDLLTRGSSGILASVSARGEGS